jgi:hypothetical protein
MIISFPSNTNDIINEIRNAIGRGVTFISKVESDCPTCEVDPVSNTSTDSFCPTCSGVGYLYTTSGYTVIAHITWGQADIINWQSVGQLFDGDCRIQVEYLPETIEAINSCSYVIVDDKKMSIDKKILRGVQTINRILLDLREQEREG